MDLASVERQQTGLVRFLIIVIMLTLSAILVVSYRAVGTAAIPYLCLVALAACLYAVSQERKLRSLHSALVQNISAKEKVLGRLGERLREESTKSVELGTRLDDLTRLYRAISAVNSVSDHDAAYDVVVRAATQLVGADTGSLMLLEGGGRALVLRSAVGLPDALLANHVSRPMGEGVSGWVAKNNEAVLLIGEAEDDDRFNHTIADTGIRYSLCVPLTHANQVLGVLNLGISKEDVSDDERTLGASDQSLANIFAQHAAVTVLNSRLLERSIA